MICRECHCEYFDSNAENPEWYCSDICDRKSAERVMEYQIKCQQERRPQPELRWGKH